MDLFSDARPTNVLWVDASAGPNGTGTADQPFQTIGAAIEKAKAGTAVMVRAGEYHENVSVPRGTNGTEDAPIWLISADGPQKAHVIAPNMNKAAIGGGGTENFVVDGFHVTGGKNGIQFSQNGLDYTDLIKNIVVKNNVIDGIVEDGIKVNGGDNVLVTNNIITGGKDEGIDFVAIDNGEISHNEVRGNTGTSAGIFAKTGSTDIRILSNYVHDVAGDGISVGGWTNYDHVMRAGHEGYMARNVVVEGNRIEDAGKRPLTFFGAVDSIATNNYLEAVGRGSTAIYVGNSNPTHYGVFHSQNVTVSDNFITREDKLLFIDTGSGGVTFENNRANVSVEKAGAKIEGAAPAEPAPTPEPDHGPKITIFTDLKQFLASDWDTSAAHTAIVRDGRGTSGADLLNKSAAVMAGGAGDDTYAVKDGTGVVETAGGGVDTLLAQSRYVSLPDHVENIYLQNKAGAVAIGNCDDNIIRGSTGDDVLVGNGGRDLLTGGGGADTFIVTQDSSVTRVTDFAPGDSILIDGCPFATFADLQTNLYQNGADTVLVLSPTRAIILENVAAKSLIAADFEFGDAGAAITAKAATNRIQANTSTHVATGSDNADQIFGSGDSIMKGGSGDDNYIIRTAGDHIIERANSGIDTVLLFNDTYVMENAVENVRVRTDTGASVVGNNLANVISGGDGDDVIAGGTGADVLSGGKGSDQFIYSSLGDRGDVINAFEIGTDFIDVRALGEAYSDLTVSTAMTDGGLAVYANHDGDHFLLATLSNVITPVDVSVLLI